MNLTFQNIKRAIAGIAVCWSLVLVLMHGKLLRHHKENENKAARLLTPNTIHVTCGNHITAVRDRQCIKRFRWILDNWNSNQCFAEFGITNSSDIDCSVYQYLIYVERSCSAPSNAVDSFSSNLLPLDRVKELLPFAMMQEDFGTLQTKLNECGKVCQWMQLRITSMQEKWIKSVHALPQNHHDGRDHSKSGITGTITRSKLRILLHMGLLTKEYGLNFGEAALVGGPLGELVQWSDLMSALHALGHDVLLSWSPTRLRKVIEPYKDKFDTCRPARTVDLIFTDLVGLEQLREIMGSLYHYRCLVRILDVYGTDPKFNHPIFNPDRGNPRTWGGRGLNPGQFFTHFPHSPDNSFLGFVVEKYDIGNRTYEKKDSALVYGKRANLLEGKYKRKYLDRIYEYFEEIHATMWTKHNQDINDVIPPYVINHKNLEQHEFLNLLRESSVYVGLGWPVDGPAALEAVANGVVFLNPTFTPPRLVTNGKPTNRKLTSQNPYAEERIGKPHVYTVDVKNSEALNDALETIKGQSRPKPHVPHEFTYIGFLERIDAYIENQDYCTDSIQTKAYSKVIWKRESKPWPPKSLLQIKLSRLGESCTSACSRHKMVCERSLFSEINSIQSIRKVVQYCAKERTVFPRQEYEKDRYKKSGYDDFAVPCHPPSYDSVAEECLLQTDQLLYSCACTPPSGVARACPCREYRKEQIALFP